MLRKVQLYIEKQQLLQADRPVLLGVSGGTDSVVLLHILQTLGYECIIAHCNFHLRMEESNRDEAFVRKLATSYQLQAYFVDFQTTEYAQKLKISIEMAARDLRYGWFDGLLKQTGAQAIAVAHHADDSIETMLLNLIRGTGLKGMTGIQARHQQVVRPLLCCSRDEIEAYRRQHQLEYVEDSTNQLTDYRRNKIRHELLPLLEQINPSVRQTLYQSAGYFQGAYLLYKESIALLTEKLRTQQSDGSILIDIEGLLQQVDVATVLHELIHPYGFNSSQVDDVVQALAAESGKVFYSDSHRLLKDRASLIISAKADIKENLYIISQPECTVHIPYPLRVTQLAVDASFTVSKSAKKVQLDAENIVFPLSIRTWKEGDWFVPFGMKQRKKLSDFFTDLKLSIADKEKVQLLCSGDTILWVIGYRTDNRFRVQAQTSRVIQFEICP